MDGKVAWRVPFVNCCQFMYLFVSLLVFRAGCGIGLYQLLIIAYPFTLVTGSAQGIGLGIARILASGGCSVILTGLAELETVDKLLDEFKR